jgi:RHS repeat-associated protein
MNYRVYADHLDTSRRVATDDDKAEVLWSWESKPFGESKATGTQVFNLRLPGQYFDVETSTHYNINRDYNPVTGRYIQSDPIGFDGGVNGFGYVGNPIRSIDPRGLRKLTYGEVQLASSIFGNTINYNTVDIYQENWAGPLYVPYAMTPWNAMYYATDNQEYRKDFSKDTHPYKVSKSLFIHEMTHIWQSQHGYPLSNIIGAITGLGDYEYEISYDRYNLYSSFEDFKLEGQATIIGDFYLKLNGINDERLTDYPTGLGKNYPLNLYRDLVGRGLGFL